MTVAPGSRLAAALGREAAEVNSLHHQAVDRLGEGLLAVAWAPDGVVEAVEGEGDAFLLGVQWHAEGMTHRAEEPAARRRPSSTPPRSGRRTARPPRSDEGPARAGLAGSREASPGPGAASQGACVETATSDLLLLEDLLSHEERAVRDRVRRFCDEEVQPIINAHWEAATFPFELLPKLAQLGVCGGSVHRARPARAVAARGRAGVDGARARRWQRQHLPRRPLGPRDDRHRDARLGGAEGARWLVPTARLELVGAFALTEPDHGSDAVTLETRARHLGDGYVIDGEKRWIGNAVFADLIIVWARDGQGEVGAYVVEKGTPGFEARLITGKIAKRASWQADVTLTDVRVPAGNRLAGARSFDDAAAVLARARPGIAWGALGHAVAAYEAAVDYCTGREQVGKPIAGYQLTQFRLAKMLADVPASGHLHAPGVAHRRGAAHAADGLARQDAQRREGARRGVAGARPARGQRHPAGEPRRPAPRRRRGGLDRGRHRRGARADRGA